ncbi:MAG TPA: PAS domain-containing protein [Terriglobia bacterium]|nr:PAS domain-containing protein [Terriglobia bacterium]
MKKLERAPTPGRKIQKPGAPESRSSKAPVLHSVLSSSSNIIFIKDSEGHYVYVNPEFQKLCGLTPEEVAGKTDYEIFPYKQAAAFRKNDLEVLRSGKPQMFEETALQEDGPHTSVVNKFPLRDSRRRIYAICGIVTDITERKTAEEHARELSLRRIQAQDEERSRISRELHDNIGSTLAALLLNLSLMKRLESRCDPAILKPLEESLALAKKSVEDVRTVAYLLHPTLLDDLGLEAGLQWYLGVYRKLSGVKVRCSFSSQVSRLPKDLEISLFNIVQQALLNIHFHSGSPEADVSIDINGATLILKIQDQGKGMPEGARPGLGIGGMQERAKLFGGNLEIISNSAGTTVTVTVPVSGTEGGGLNAPIPSGKNFKGRLPAI